MEAVNEAMSEAVNEAAGRHLPPKHRAASISSFL